MNKIIRIIASTVLTSLILSGSMCATAYAQNSKEESFQEAYETISETGFISKEILKEDLQSKVSRSNYEELLKKINNKLNAEPSIDLENTKPIIESTTILPDGSITTNIEEKIANDSQEKVENAFITIKPLTREEALADLVSVLISSNLKLELSNNVENLKLFDDFNEITKDYLPLISTALQNEIVSINEDFLLNPKDTPTYEEIILWLEKVNKLHTEKKETENPFYILDPSKKIKVNPEVDEDGNITWNTVNNVKYYTILVKNEKGEVVYEDEVYEDTSLDATKVLKSGITYDVIIGIILEDDTEVFSLPIKFKYLGVGDQIVAEVKKYLGISYVWGGSTPRGFDCSGLTQYVCNKVGIKINRTASDQFRNNGKYVSRNELLPGDLVYFGSGNYATHTGVYVGDGQMIHAPRTGDVVKYTSIDNSYFKSRFIGGKRVS